LRSADPLTMAGERGMNTSLLEVLLSGACGAIIGAVLTGWLTVWLQGRHEQKRETEERLFGVYMLLLNAKSWHWWIATSEHDRERPRSTTAREFNRIRWQIADEIRRIDRVQIAEDVLRVLFDLGFASEAEREKELDKIVNRLGRQVNARYADIMESIHADNGKLLAADLDTYLDRLGRLQESVPPEEPDDDDYEVNRVRIGPV
jgi:hypothetical protein